jgi:methionyl aminopeptidase
LDPDLARLETAGMAIELFAEADVARLRRAGRIAAETLAAVGARLRAGIATAEIDRWVREDTKSRGGVPSQLGYKGFPAAVCTSRNEVVCHGMPSKTDVLRDGDIVNVDVTTMVEGFHGDTSATFAIGAASPAALRLVETARRCRDAGIAVVRDGVRLGDVGAAIAEVAHAAGYSVVVDFGGHGIGRKMHMDPHVPHTGTRGAGIRLRAGMAFTIEPMINEGTADVSLKDDGWTVVTADGRLSAQFEHTVVVTKDGCEVTTRLDASG